MPKQRKRKKTVGRKRRTTVVDLLALGEGPAKGRIFEKARQSAENNSQKRFVIVDLKRPEYNPPSTLQFFSQDAIRFLQNTPMNSVRRIEDKYFISNLIWGNKTSDKDIAKTARQIKTAAVMEDITNTITKGSILQKIRRRSDAYIKLVKKVLVPGGKFIMLSGPAAMSTYKSHLEKIGFIVKSKSLTKKQIMNSGSKQAIGEFKKDGTIAHYIIATKPKNKT